MAEEEEKGELPCKVVLIGESGNGKTSIISVIFQINSVQF
jgi:ABC-type transport system involved in cytochrome bd biosynthesis fused ATPase/permease subunit